MLWYTPPAILAALRGYQPAAAKQLLHGEGGR
jgi:hypothetical protein